MQRVGSVVGAFFFKNCSDRHNFTFFAYNAKGANCAQI